MPPGQDALPASAGRPAPPLRGLRALWRLTLLAGVFAAAWLLLPAVAEQVLKNQLAQRGFRDVALVVDGLSPGGVRLAGVALSRGFRAQAAAIAVSWRLAELWQGRIDTVTLSGVALEVELPAAGGTSAGTALPRLPGLPALPCASVAIDAGQLTLRRGSRSWTVPFHGRLHQDDARTLQVSLDASVGAAVGQPDVHLVASGALDPSGEWLAGALTLALTPLRWQAQDGLGQELQSALALETAGRLALSGQLRIQAGELQPELTVALSGGEVARRDAGFTLRDVAGTWTLTGVAPLATAGPQTLTFGGGQLGQFALQSGSVVAALTAAGQLQVDRLEWSMGAAGRFAAEPFRLDPRTPEVDVALRVEGADLGEWLRVLASGRATGTGTLAGRVTARVRTAPRLQVTPGRGELHTDGGGRLQIRDAATLGTLLDQTAAGLGGNAEHARMVQDRITRSLQDFAYQKLAFDLLEKPGGGLTLRATSAGKGVQVPQELNLTVNFNGFEDVVALAIGLQRTAEKAGTLIPTTRPKGDR